MPTTFDFDQSVADRETPGDTATIHQDALRDKFTDQIGDIYPLTDHHQDDMPESSRAGQFRQR